MVSFAGTTAPRGAAPPHEWVPINTSDAGYRDEVTLPITLDGASGHRIERFAWIGNGSPPDGAGPVTYGALSPLTRIGRAWRTTTPAPVSFAASASLVVSPRHIIEPEQLMAWDLTTARWLRIRPSDAGPRTGASAGWLQGRLLLWGGTTTAGAVTGEGWAFTPWLGRRTVALPEQSTWFPDGCGQTGDRVLALAPRGRTADVQYLGLTEEGWRFKTGGSRDGARGSARSACLERVQ